MTVRIATPDDAPEVVRVINAAFNPAEAFFVDGDRIALAEVRYLFEKGAFFVTGEMDGVVYVELRGERAYFGLLSVDPARQKGGIGRALIAAAENYAREHNCRDMDLRIVNLRVELPAFYERLGYRIAGEEPFTPGSPIKIPCHFVKMTKPLT